MPYIPTQQSDTGSFVPTTNVWDVSQLYEVDVTSPEFKELLVRLYQNVNNIATALNTKDSAFYLLELFATGQLYFNAANNNQLMLRPAFRKVINTGPFGAGVTTVAHGIPFAATWSTTIIPGSATDNIGFNYYPLPFPSASGANNIETRLTATDLVITNNSGVTFTSGVVIVEVLQQ